MQGNQGVVFRFQPICLALPAILLGLALLSPFVGKAFTIDDTLFLREAEQIVSKPLRPGAFDMIWDEDEPVRMAAGSLITGPMGGYLLVPVIWAGGSEVVGHVLEFILLCCAAVATASLGLLLGLEPWKASAAAILLVSTPAVLGMAGTVMPDIAALAFGIMGVERYFAWSAQRRRGQAIAAAALLAAAILTRSHLLCLLAVLGLAELVRRWIWKLPQGAHLEREAPGADWWRPLAAAFLIALFVQLITRDTSQAASNSLPFIGSLLSLRHIPRNLLAVGVNWVVALPLGIAWLALRWRAMLRYVAAGLLAAACIPLPHWAPRWAALAATIGFLVLGDILLEALRRRDSIQLLLGLWLLMSFVTLPYAHHPAKYEVPAAGAAALLIVRQLPFAPRKRTVAGLASLVALGGCTRLCHRSGR
jgi:hypothetical protein